MFSRTYDLLDMIGPYPAFHIKQHMLAGMWGTPAEWPTTMAFSMPNASSSPTASCAAPWLPERAHFSVLPDARPCCEGPNSFYRTPKHKQRNMAF